jgi:hypothetical protein
MVELILALYVQLKVPIACYEKFNWKNVYYFIFYEKNIKRCLMNINIQFTSNDHLDYHV